MSNPNPKYSDREQIMDKLADAAKVVNGSDDKALLMDAANWISKYGRAHGALDEVLKVARQRCDPDTITALEAAMQKGAGFASNRPDDV